ncbi:methyltransferase, FkbM family [Thiorhodovibrio winogradskyi]|uniref:Methyltransferase, FkbM family n=1 Tax=Thiorhodovibrio winogradskyi TaxID=77007 RepID=A0ABZ0SEZ9_9GAMM|nr:hypothetical protein [Thiorhodovibrio winogradskyi]
MVPPIFAEFKRKNSVSDGQSVYDFLGGAVDSSYKRGWRKNVSPIGTLVKPGYPAPSEWTVDWIACLLAARLAGDRFSVIELGAGYGQWMVASIMAYKTLHPDRPCHGMALEAEATHYEWLRQHVKKNLGGYQDVRTDLMQAAAGYDGAARFPVIKEPDRDYGASYQAAAGMSLMTEVDCFSMKTIDELFAEPVIDVLHVDIQGAEADLIANPGFKGCLSKTRFALFGTHRSDELHKRVRVALEHAGLRILIEWPRNGITSTPFGEIKTYDGAIFGLNPKFENACNALVFGS